MGYIVTIAHVIIGTLGSDMKKTLNELMKLLTKQELVVKTAAEMYKTILMESETLLTKVLSGLVQIDIEKNKPFS